MYQRFTMKHYNHKLKSIKYHIFVTICPNKVLRFKKRLDFKCGISLVYTIVLHRDHELVRLNRHGFIQVGPLVDKQLYQQMIAINKNYSFKTVKQIQQACKHRQCLGDFYEWRYSFMYSNFIFLSHIMVHNSLGFTRNVLLFMLYIFSFFEDPIPASPLSFYDINKKTN